MFRCEECNALLKTADDVYLHDCSLVDVVTPESDVPDKVGEVIGWRGWEVGATGGLFSINGVFWPKGDYLQAVCSPGNRIHRTGHQAPHPSCTCGVYAARSLDHLQSLSYNRGQTYQGTFENRRVVGQVALSGKIVPHEQGYRAEKARPLKIYVPYETWKMAERVKQMYGVEVELANTYA